MTPMLPLFPLQAVVTYRYTIFYIELNLTLLKVL
jgi:hypothetical protein